MSDAPEDGLPPSLRFLKTLVTVLTAVMIGGVLVIIGLLVTTLRAAPPPMTLPATIALPDGALPAAITQAQDWLGVVTTDGRMFVYDRASGALRQEIRIAPAPVPAPTPAADPAN